MKTHFLSKTAQSKVGTWEGHRGRVFRGECSSSSMLGKTFLVVTKDVFKVILKWWWMTTQWDEVTFCQQWSCLDIGRPPNLQQSRMSFKLFLIEGLLNPTVWVNQFCKTRGFLDLPPSRNLGLYCTKSQEISINQSSKIKKEKVKTFPKIVPQCQTRPCWPRPLPWWEGWGKVKETGIKNQSRAWYKL